MRLMGRKSARRVKQSVTLSQEKSHLDSGEQCLAERSRSSRKWRRTQPHLMSNDGSFGLSQQKIVIDWVHRFFSTVFDFCAV